ncbi:MAG: hypothetical protein ISR69_00320 [Gammaproteobacteria bacterium]|nr:hypothetical protein [Gammaproteobacteria bacterium]
MGTPIKQVLFRHSPLWMRAPSRDEKGRLYSDFMMIVPELKGLSEVDKDIQSVVIKEIIEQFLHVVVYADINTKLNILWVSHQSIPGVSKPIVEAVMQKFPNARIVNSGYSPESSSTPAKLSLLGKFRLKLKQLS